MWKKFLKTTPATLFTSLKMSQLTSLLDISIYRVSCPPTKINEGKVVRELAS